jgi:hypothetical protein
MSTSVRVVGYLLGLLVVFLAARGVGAVAAPEPAPPPPMAHDDMGASEGEDEHSGTEEESEAHGDHDEPDPAASADGPGGLAVSDQGYTLRIVALPRPGSGQQLQFVVDGPDGKPVTSYDEVHERPLHLVAIRRDGADYHHLHPTLREDGTWTAPLRLSSGTTRLFADFTPTDGPALVLGTDVHVDGDYEPMAPPEVTRTVTVDDYQVRLAGTLAGGSSSKLTAVITRNGKPVTDLQPYLGAYGHLVALREGDLAYLHVHPEEAGAGPRIPFVAEIPSNGRYRLFLEFRHDGAVHTAGFTLAAGEGYADAHGEEAGHEH